MDDETFDVTISDVTPHQFAIIGAAVNEKVEQSIELYKMGYARPEDVEEAQDLAKTFFEENEVAAEAADKRLVEQLEAHGIDVARLEDMPPEEALEEILSGGVGEGDATSIEIE